MDGSTSAGDAVRAGGASNVHAERRTGAPAMEGSSSIWSGLSNVVTAAQLICFAAVIVIDLLADERTGSSSLGTFTNSVLLLCGFAFELSIWGRTRKFSGLKDIFLEMGRRSLHIAALVFVAAVLSTDLGKASWEELEPTRTFLVLLAIGWLGLGIVAVLEVALARDPVRCVVVFGDGQPAFLLAQQIRREMPRARVCLYPMVHLSPAADRPESVDTPIYADPKLVELAPEVAVIGSIASDDVMDGLAARLAPLSLDVLVHAPSGGRWGFGPMVTFAAMPFVRVFPRPLRPWQAVLKRTFDIAVSALLIVLLLPLLCCVAFAIKLDSRGSILFRQPRVGRGGSHFTVCKFRTMRTEATDVLADRPTVSNDPRLTRIGGFLRKSSIDELPQLFNVLLGSMSIVGPRPHAMNGNDFSAVVANYHARHRVKPGITGLAQVLGWRGPTDTRTKIEQRVANDLRYISDWSLGQDLLIIGRTVFALYGKNAF